MKFKLKLNKEINEIFNEASKIVYKNKQEELLIPHILLATLENEEVFDFLESEFNLKTESINEIKNELESEIYLLNNQVNKINKKEENRIKLNSYILVEYMSDLIKYTESFENNERYFDVIKFLSFTLNSLNDYKKNGIQFSYLNSFESKISLEHKDSFNCFIKTFYKETGNEFSDKIFEELTEDELDSLNKDLFEDSLDNKNPKIREEKIPNYLRSLNQEVIRSDNYETLYENSDKIDKITYILSKKDKSIPLLIGDNGVGKTSLIHSLCKKIITKNASPKLVNKEILELDLVKLFAGCMYRGSLEEKISAMFDFLSNRNNFILFVDGLKINKNSNHQEEFIGSFFSYLKRNKTKCIISMNQKDYQKAFKNYPVIVSDTSLIEIQEPDFEVTKKIVMDNINGYEKFHNVAFKECIISEIIQLSNKYIVDKKNPEKTFEIIDELGALKSSGIKKDNYISQEDVLNIISEKSKVNIRKEKSELEKVVNLEKEIKKNIFGQENAIDLVSSAIMVSAAGFNDENRPYLSLMFTGTTGVGKTELVKQVSNNLNRKLIRYDMSEYSESHTVSKLIGSPSGYVGYDDGGLLTNEVKKNPYSVILFDEIEKGHKKVFDIFLQILDEGNLTDSQGNSVSFKNTIVIFTSNAGVEQKNKSSIGFSDDNEGDKINYNVLTKYFKPEFLNRIDSIVEFNKLNKKVMVDIATKNLIDFSEKLNNKKIKLNYTPKVKNWLAERGFNKKMGARPMKRLVNKEIVEGFSKAYLEKKIKGEKIKECNIKVKNEELIIDIN